MSVIPFNTLNVYLFVMEYGYRRVCPHCFGISSSRQGTKDTPPCKMMTSADVAVKFQGHSVPLTGKTKNLFQKVEFLLL